MRTEILENLFLVEIRDIRSVKQQILDALARVAKGASADGMGQALMRLLETVEHHVERLDRIFSQATREIGGEWNASPSIAEHVGGALERTTACAAEPLPRCYSRLTSREIEVLQLMAEGQTKRQIGSALGLSVRSVEKHRQRVMAKLDLPNTAAATRCAVLAGVAKADE